MALPPSKLKEVIEGLAEDFSMKARAVPSMLKKHGVKDEELQFAKLGLPEPDSQQGMKAWTKDMLKDAESKRADKQGVLVEKGKYDTDYGSVNVRNPTDDYEERVYTFETKGTDKNFRSEHFPSTTSNYLAHTRIQPMDINGKKARTILELQSDLHARNREIEDANTILKSIANKDLTEKQYEDLSFIYKDEIGSNTVFDWLDKKSPAELSTIANKLEEASLKTNAPYESSINRKLIERELFNAVEEGALHTAIPLRGPGTRKLHRSEAIQETYENQIYNTATKIAKQQGLDYKIEKAGALPGSVDKEEFEKSIGFLRTTYGPVDDAIRAYRANPSRENAAAIKEAQSGMTASRSEAGLKTINNLINNPDLEDLGHMLMTKKLNLQEYIDEVTKLSDKPKPGREVEYLVIDHPKGTKLNVNLYASPVATAGAAYMAYKAGYGEEEVSKYLVEKQGYSEEEAKSMAAKTKKAIDAGYSQEEVVAHFDSKEVTEPKQDEVKVSPAPAKAISKPISADQAAEMSHPSQTLDHSYYARVYRATTTTAENAKELVSSQEVLRPAMVSAIQQTKAFAGYDNKTNELVAQKTTEQRQHIIDFAAQKGVQLEYDPTTIGWRVMTEQGWQNANPELWDGIKKAKGEISASLAGALVGAKYGRNIGIAAFPEVAPVSGPGGAVLGAIGGGAIGAVVGSELDYIYEAMTHNAEMDAAVQQRRTLNAAQASLLYDTIGAVALRTPSAVKSLTTAIRNIPEKINPSTSIDNALANTMFINKDEANDLVRIMERFSEVPGKTDIDKRVAASIYSLPGSEGIASAVAKIDPLASRAIAKTIDNRAQDLLRTSENLTDENLTKLVTQDLKNYEADVKNFYTAVKAKAAETPNAANYQFNLNKLAIDPVLESLKRNIEDPRTMEKFVLQVNRIQQFSKSRDFNDLLELRKTVNNFKYNTKITSSKDYERVNQVVANIDAAIQEGAHKVIPNADEWLTSFKEANLSYAQMMTLKKNVLYKSLMKPGQDYDRTVSALTKYITAEDSTFMDVVAKLPNHTKAKVEGSVVNALTEKYTAGTPGGERAVYFPQLSQSLDSITFTTPETRKFKGAVQAMAEVFRNDVPLASVSGSLKPPTDTSILTSDLLAATKRTFASKVFNYAKRTIGSDSSKLIYKAAEVLENPLNNRSMKELMAELDGRVNIDKEAQELVSATAKEQAEKGFVGAPKVILYGDGSILSSKAGNGTKTSIPLHRIATIEQATKVAESEGINPADTKLLDAALSSLGYKAVQQGADKVRVLK